MSSPDWHPVTAADEPRLLALMQAFYAEEQLTFDLDRARSVVREIVATSDLGQIFLLREGEVAHGYLALTFGFSLEFGGRFVLLDELYLVPGLRGQGWGSRSVAFAETWTRRQGVAALRLELNRANAHARRVYLKAGFTDDGRDLLTRRL